MTDQTLRQLLLDADAAASPPTTDRDSPPPSAIACAAVAPLNSPPPRSSSPPPSPRAASSPTPKTTLAIDTSKAQAELSLIRLQANSQAATVNRLASYQRTLTLRATAAKKAEMAALWIIFSSTAKTLLDC